MSIKLDSPIFNQLTMMPSDLTRTELLSHARFYIRAKRIFPGKSNTRTRRELTSALADAGLVDKTPVITTRIYSDVKHIIAGHIFWLMYSTQGTDLLLDYLPINTSSRRSRILTATHTLLFIFPITSNL